MPFKMINHTMRLLFGKIKVLHLNPPIKKGAKTLCRNVTNLINLLLIGWMLNPNFSITQNSNHLLRSRFQKPNSNRTLNHIWKCLHFTTYFGRVITHVCVIYTNHFCYDCVISDVMKEKFNYEWRCKSLNMSL